MKGTLKDFALSRIDEQTKILISENGDNQINYRFFIGIKLDINEETNFKSTIDDILSFVNQFINDINNKLMNDFYKIDEKKVRRCSNLESLLSSKLERRFSVRKITTSDISYILQHLSPHRRVYLLPLLLDG